MKYKLFIPGSPPVPLKIYLVYSLDTDTQYCHLRDIAIICSICFSVIVQANKWRFNNL